MSRKFDGKIYTGMRWYATKPKAEKAADTWRKHGNLARIVKGTYLGKKMWHLYVR